MSYFVFLSAVGGGARHSSVGNDKVIALFHVCIIMPAWGLFLFFPLLPVPGQWCRFRNLDNTSFFVFFDV